MELIVTTPEALKAIVQDALRAHNAQTQPRRVAEQYLTPLQTAERLNVSTATVKRWAQDGRLTRLQHGRVVRYRLTEVDAVLSEIK